MSATMPKSFSNPIALVIPTSQSSITKTPKTKVEIYYADIDTSNPVSLADLKTVLIQVTGKMHVRGDATAAMPKQQYSVSLKDDPTTGNFLGMAHGGKHWVFNDCGAVDYTLLRNTLAFKQQQLMGQYAPAFKFFELFILPENTDMTTTTLDADFLGKYYHGLYLNFDKIRFQGSRIDLPYDKHNVTSDYAVIQLNQYSDKYQQLTPNPPLTANVEVYEPELKDTPAAVQPEFNDWFYNNSNDSWAGNFANAFSNYANQDKPIPASLFSDIQAVTDYKSFATYFILNEIARDPDGYHKSTFMVKNKAICFAGPLWDKNKSYGNTASCSGYSTPYISPEGWLYSITGQSPVWWGILIKDPVFCKEVWSQWSNIMAGQIFKPTPSSWMKGFIDEEVEYIKNTGALARDGQQWPNAFNSSTENYDEQVSDLTSYMDARYTWINKNLSAELKAQSGFDTNS